MYTAKIGYEEMSYMNKKKQSINNAVSVVLAVFVMLPLLALSLCGCGIQKSNETEPSPSAAVTEGTLMPTVDAEEDLLIDTPYAVICYPKKYEEYLYVTHSQGEVYRVSFFADFGAGKTMRLFTLLLNCDIAQALGEFESISGEKILVGIESKDLTFDGNWSEDEISTVRAMQEALNHVLSALRIEEVSQRPTQMPSVEVSETEAAEPMTIDTPYGQLFYPANHGDHLEIVTEDGEIYSLQFCCTMDGKRLPLFTIYFGGTQGTPAATLSDAEGNETQIYLVIEDLVFGEEWSEEEKTLAYAMQEDVNFLLGNLAE